MESQESPRTFNQGHWNLKWGLRSVVVGVIPCVLLYTFHREWAASRINAIPFFLAWQFFQLFFSKSLNEIADACNKKFDCQFLEHEMIVKTYLVLSKSYQEFKSTLILRIVLRTYMVVKMFTHYAHIWQVLSCNLWMNIVLEFFMRLPP